MPQHTAHDYLTKFNSHFGFVEDEMTNNIRNNNKNEYSNDVGEEEYDANYFSKKRFRNVVPMGFVSKLNGEDDCFVFRDFDKVTREGRREDVKYFVSLVKESIVINDSYNSSSCRVALVKLGKLGCKLDESKVIKLRHEFKSNTSLECNSIFWHHVCEERNSVSNTIKILIFTDRKYWTVYFQLNQKSPENSTIIIESEENFVIPFFSQQFLGRWQTISIGERRLLFLMGHCLENYFTHLIDESNLEIVHSGESHLGKFYFEFSPVIPLMVGNGVFILGLQDHAVDLFELKFLEEDGKIRESLEKIDIKVKTPQDVKFYFGEQARVSQLTETKFLMAVFKTYEYEPNIEGLSQYYQEFFLNGLKWFLLDLKNMEFERVYPKVYEIGKQISLHQNQDTFSLVKRKSRGRNNVHSSQFYQDGDLNGGYSDSNLFESFKRSESYNFQFVNPHNMEMIQNYNALSLSALNSCRISNNSFQVYFTVSYCLEGTNSDEKVKEKMWNSNLNQYGKMFRFTFIFKDQAIEKLFGNIHLASELSDICFHFE